MTIPKEARASDIMKKNPVTISPDKIINDARFLFRTHTIGGLPVVENGRLVGIFTLADLKKARRGTDKIADVMTKNPAVAHAEDTIESIFNRLMDNRIGRIPIISKASGELLGLVSLSDIKNLSRFHAISEGPRGPLKALKCQSCNAPLGTPTGRFVKCGYCRTINEI